MHYFLKKTTILCFALCAVSAVFAQKKKKTAAPPKRAVQSAPAQAAEKTVMGDTSSPKMVTITSAFKPSLKSAAKVNFIAATPVIDSSKIPVVYNVPSQNLFFSYKAVAIKPLGLQVDTAVKWENDHYVKVGAGNFSTYMGEAGFSFGDGEHSITNLKGNFITSTGHLFAQQASRLNIDALTIFKTGNSHEWNAHAFYRSNTQYFYGVDSTPVAYTKSALLQRFNTVGIEIGVQNKLENPNGIRYNPQLSFIRFSDNHEVAENDLVVKLPFSKVFNKFYAFNVGLTADMSSTDRQLIPNSVNVKNNIYYVQPAFLLTTPNLKLHLGFTPSWDNKVFSGLPEISAEAKITDQLLFLEAGWKGYYQKNTYRTLSAFNPWITGAASNNINTKISEQFVGVKVSPGDHFTFNARVSLLKFTNQALFTNNMSDGKYFDVLYEPDMKAIRLHAEAAYTISEKVSVLAATSYTQYNGLTVNPKAWGLLPFEMTGTLKWKPLKDLQLKSDIFLWDGSPYRSRYVAQGKSDPVADINLGAEFTIVPRLNIWLQMNNMLNSTYQRWNQYPVLGFNVLGGVVYSFR